MRRSPLFIAVTFIAMTGLLIACGNGTAAPDTGEDAAVDPYPDEARAPDEESADEETTEEDAAGGDPEGADESPADDPEPDAEVTEDDNGTGEESADDEATEDATDEEPTQVETEVTDVVTGLDAPWDVAFTDERVFVTERDSGDVLEVTGDGATEVVRSFDVDASGEAGLLGLVAAPEQVADGTMLYAYYTSVDDNRIVRFDPDDDAEPEVVFSQIPSAPTHDGGRMVFGPDDLLYVGTGDAQDAAAAQDPDSLAGKILRMEPDGGVPEDNPFEGTAVYSIGHRNVQGLAFGDDGTLYASEFGPEVDDEVNVIEPGGNYGWPEVTGEAGDPDYIDPIFVRQPDVGSWSGLAMLTDGAIPQWEGDLFLASLRGERMWRMELEDGEVVADEEFFVSEHGRLRQVRQAPDGSLWIITNNTDGRGNPADGDDRILRLGPAE